ncbi:serine/threonine-protein kinase 36-like [Rhinoraja longicauda]
MSITPPGGLGTFDALLTLLLQFVSQGAAVDLLQSELWPSLWQRVAHALHLPLDRPIMEGETPRAGRATPTPDWNSLSPSGLLAFLTIATHVFTAAPSQCIALMSSPTSVVLATLGHLLTEQFLHHLDQRLGAVGELPLDCGGWLVLRVCQLLCFPFAVDVEGPLLTDVLQAFLEVEVVPHLALHEMEMEPVVGRLHCMTERATSTTLCDLFRSWAELSARQAVICGCIDRVDKNRWKDAKRSYSKRTSAGVLYLSVNVNATGQIVNHINTSILKLSIIP